MRRAIERWTTTASLALVFGALSACKKKTDAPAPAAREPVAATVAAVASAAAPIETAAPNAAPVAIVDAGVAAPVLGAVKRFPDKEKVASGAVKVTLDDSKVYDEPDNSKPSVASLSRDLFVVRLATLGTDWVLVDFPSGIGKLSPGWIESKSVGEQVHAAVSKAAVAAQTASAKPAAAPSTKPATSAAPVATTTAAALVPSSKPSTVAVPASARPKPGAILSRPHK
jgi:hypothetical protein